MIRYNGLPELMKVHQMLHYNTKLLSQVSRFAESVLFPHLGEHRCVCAGTGLEIGSVVWLDFAELDKENT